MARPPDVGTATPAVPDIKPVVVKVWLWSIDAPAIREADWSVLSADEQDRAARFVFEPDRASYAAARAGMRRRLAEHTGRRSDELVFSYGDSGKPSLAAGPHFNLAHSGGRAMLAISDDADVGIDIEKIRDIELAIADRFYSPAENAVLGRTPDGDKLEAFFRCWTRKEAALKAVGCGLNRDTRTFSVQLDDAGTPDVLLSVVGLEATPEADRAWTLLNVAVEGGFCGALAVRANGRTVEVSSVTT